MSNSIKLTLYTQPLCDFCDIMKMKLKEWGYDFNVINVKDNPQALAFLRLEGHKTVPQLYYQRTHVNKVDTVKFTKQMLEEAIDPDNFSGGVENWR
jgi:glutaredoxin